MNYKFVKIGIADAIRDHREYWALQGVWDEKDACSTNLISKAEFEKLKTNFSNITNYFTFDKCD